LSLCDVRRKPRLTDSEAGLFLLMDVCFVLLGVCCYAECLLCCRVFVVVPVLDGWPEFKVSPILAENAKDEGEEWSWRQ